MSKQEVLLTICSLGIVTALFFYKTVLSGYVPFPGDILASDFQPWRSTSYLGYAAGGIPNKAQYPDTIRQIYPWKMLAIAELKEGKLPLWNPYNFSGTPLLANFQTAALYPLGVLYLMLSQVAAWTILVILQPFLAALFTYLFARKLRMTPLAASLAALSYGFSGFVAVWLEYNTVGHVILWLPLLLLSIENLKSNRRALWLGVIAMVNAAALLAGHPQVYAYMVAFTLVYGMFRLSVAQWMLTFLFCLFGMGIAGIQLIPGLELIANAARSPHEFTNLLTKILIHPWQMLSLPFPNILGNPATRTYWPADTFVGKVTTIGLIPLFFSLSALRRKDAVTKWFIAASLGIFLLITSNPVTQILYRIPLPLISSSSPTLMSFLFAFSLAMMCGLGLDHWMTEQHSVKKLVRRTLEVAAIFGVLFLTTKLPITPELSEHAPVAIRALFYGAIVSAATLVLFWVAITLPKFRTHAILLLLVVHVVDLFMFFNRFNPFVPKTLVFPQHAILSALADKTPERYWGYGTANIAANFASQYHIYSPEGYDPLYPKWYGEFLYAYQDGKPLLQFSNATRSDAAIVSGFGANGMDDVKKRRMLDAVSVRFILDRTENGSTEVTFPPDNFRKTAGFEDWRIFENLSAAPRVFLTNDVVSYIDANDFGTKFFASEFNPARKVLLPETVPVAPSKTPGAAAILSYSPEKVTIKTESQVSSVLVLTDTYYPGWIAKIDETPAEILRANWAQRAVVVPQGTHTVTMTYAPKSVTVGLILSIISIVATITTMAIIKKKS